MLKYLYYTQLILKHRQYTLYGPLFPIHELLQKNLLFSSFFIRTFRDTEPRTELSHALYQSFFLTKCMRLKAYYNEHHDVRELKGSVTRATVFYFF